MPIYLFRWRHMPFGWMLGATHTHTSHAMSLCCCWGFCRPPPLRSKRWAWRQAGFYDCNNCLEAQRLGPDCRLVNIALYLMLLLSVVFGCSVIPQGAPICNSITCRNESQPAFYMKLSSSSEQFRAGGLHGFASLLLFLFFCFCFVASHSR